MVERFANKKTVMKGSIAESVINKKMEVDSLLV